MTKPTAIKEKDLLDRVELPLEEKVVYSETMESVVREAIRNEIAKLPIGKIVASVLEKEVLAQKELADKRIDSNIEKAKDNLASELEKLKAEMEKLEDKMRKKHDEFRSLFGRSGKPWYQFGGYPSAGEGLVVPGAAGLQEWRIIVVGANLSVQKLEAGVWNEKAVFLPSV